MVEGYQNGDVPFAATLKHFLGYGFSLSGKDRTPAWIPERELREYFLPSFQAAIDAGAMSVMVNSGEINGIPVHANRYLLTDLLRDELGFEGVVSDSKTFATSTPGTWWPKTTRGNAHGIEAGIDMSMVPFDLEFSEDLVELVQEGTISMERVDLSVQRILNMKWELGLFETAGMPPALILPGQITIRRTSSARGPIHPVLKNEGSMRHPVRPILPIGGTGTV